MGGRARRRLGPSERRERIAEYVIGRETVAARELAARFDVSLMTVHRDLDGLERQGVLRKVHGGATPQPPACSRATSATASRRRGRRRRRWPATP